MIITKKNIVKCSNVVIQYRNFLRIFSMNCNLLWKRRITALSMTWRKRGEHMNKQIFVLYFNIFLIFLGIGLVIPVLPVYLKDLGLTGSDLGLLVAAFALSQMIISPFGGTLADKLGKKLIICIGLILFSVSEFMFAVGHNFSVLMLSRVIGGMSAGMVMPGVTGLIADISPSHQKAKTLATCQRLSILDSF